MEIVKKILNIFSKKLTTTKTDTPQYVDLGLPSGLKWAKCNIGAKTETDYGYYFQWGDIVNKRKSNCGWKRHKHCDGSFTTLTKYNTNSDYGTVDNKTTLDPEDDAARVNMKGDRRMPSAALMEELISETINVWITNYNSSGINGRKFTSKKDTSKYIFIPASGLRNDSSFDSQGSDGSVWSSSLYSSSPEQSRFLYFNSNNIVADDGNYRERGYTVRGVL